MINEWLDEFKRAWLEKDIASVLDLFTDDVEYWETQFNKLNGIVVIRDEWAAIHDQYNIDLELDVFASNANKHAVVWRLTYQNKSGEISVWRGTYLIKLTTENKCSYFLQTGEQNAIRS